MASRLTYVYCLALVCSLTLLTPAILSGAEPVAFWTFSAEEETPLTAHGNVHRDVPGPRPPLYPSFEAGNTAVKFDGGGAYFSFADSGAKSPFDFLGGDAITIEAWLEVDDLRNGENLYIIGKGRTGAKGFARDNQNWALRIRGVKGQACVSFLFATPIEKDAPADAHWHRWTTSEGFAPKTGWHHIAVSYRFGTPDSVRGWIDGKSVAGAWDMGGATKENPVVDDDAIWIGSSQGGHAGNSFRGSLDAVGIHREILADDILAARFRREGGPVVARPAAEVLPDLGELPAGVVQATFHEGMPSHDRWLLEGEEWPPETLRWKTNEFLLPGLPLRYDEWGIRESWKPSVLVRLAAEVAFPPGRHTVLIRARGLSRLWVNGKVVARTKPLTGSPSGEEPITPVAEPPLPGLRAAGHRLQESLVEISIEGDSRAQVVFEALAGGKAFRAEPGELCVAIKTADGKSFSILAPVGSTVDAVPLTDHAVEAALARFDAALSAYNDTNRRAAAASRDEFWRRRHLAARDWADNHPAPDVPAGLQAKSHPIDAFLADKIARAKAAAASVSSDDARRFHSTVLPILRAACYRCHGEKAEGGLRLDSRERALTGGDTGEPALVPGKSNSSALLARIKHENPAERMPPTGQGLKPEQIKILETWIDSGAAWPPAPLSPEQTAVAPEINDAAFLRRVYLDTVGVPPSEPEVRGFLADTASDKREQLVKRLLDDARWADHWMGYWQDLLAENPTLINATLNSTGPFRWFLYEGLRDDKPLDRLITELLLMRGSAHEGGSAGFGLAAQNDAPLAAKAHVVASAFLGIELQCARCHDSPYHSTKQRDLYALSAMLARKTVSVPKSSSVPEAFFENKSRESLIRVTLKPGETISSDWPFAKETGATDDDSIKALLEHPDDSRERLAALITAPQNTRFAQVVVNRIWRRFMGAGLVEPAHDWEGRSASHPELLKWLAHEFVSHGYSVKHVARLILTSRAYGRDAVGRNLAAEPELRFFNAPERRRLTAEQLVDSLYVATGRSFDVEELTLDPDGRRPASNRQTLGHPKRAWMFVSLSNERDRPSLTLPRAAAVTEVLETFGWSAARQTPRTDREISPSVLQPGVLANSSLIVSLARAAQDSPLAELAIKATGPAELVDTIFMRFLGRPPMAKERELFVPALTDGFSSRLVPQAEVERPTPPARLPRVTWSNHLRSEANTIQQEWERRVRLGPPADARLRSEWREVYEDVVWSVVNLPEFAWMP